MDSLRKFLAENAKNLAIKTKSMIVVSLNYSTSVMNDNKTMYGNYTINIGSEKRNDTAKIISGQIAKDCKSFSYFQNLF